MPSPFQEPTSGGTGQVTFQLLRRFLPGDSRRVLVGLVLLLASSGVVLLQPWPLKLVLDCVVGSHPAPGWLASFQRWIGPGAAGPKMALLVALCLGLLFIELVLGALNILSAYILNSVALRLVFKLRCALFDHVQRLSLSFHDASTVGDSLYRIAWDSYCVQAIFSEGAIPGLTAAATLLGIAIVMLSRDWRLTVVTLGVAVPLILLVRSLDKPMTEQSTRVHEFESEVSTRVQETLTGIRAVQAYGREQFESERFRGHAKASLQANLRLTVVQTTSQAIVGLLLAAGTAAVIGLGAQSVLHARMTTGDLVLLVTYVAMIFKPLETLAYTAGAVQNAAAGARRVLAVLNSRSEVKEAPQATELAQPVSGAIAFENVAFAYRKDLATLHDINLCIPSGSSIAIVGPSGAGKTTLASLLLRFYDPSHGRVTVDGQDIRGLTLGSLRKQIALVTQEPVLFAASIRENIAYGLPGATQQQIEKAAREAGAHDFIMKLPDRYETRLAERGTTLSSGQRQRLGLARAFLKNAPILILDEPTSALDAETEEALLQALETLMRGRTTLIIAHRLSTVRCAERIVVLEEGAIRETGTEAELLARGGAYARLHDLQFGEAGETVRPPSFQSQT